MCVLGSRTLNEYDDDDDDVLLKSKKSKVQVFSKLLLRLGQFFSTETAVLKVVSDVLAAMNRGQITLLGMFDLGAAFDTVDHAILLKRLDVNFGIRGNALNWFASYLSGRSRQVSVHGILASSFYLEFGDATGFRAGTSFVSSLHYRSCCIGAGLWSFSACLCR